MMFNGMKENTSMGKISEVDVAGTKMDLKHEVSSLPDKLNFSQKTDLLPDTYALRSEVKSLPGTLKLKKEEMDSEGKSTAPDKNMERVKEGDKVQKNGGSYGEVFRDGEGEKYEVHHMPADSASNLERNDGPAIRMEKEDHRQTASCGNSREAREYRAQQRELIEQGKFREALQMDIDDIHDKFGNKYDDAIKEMLEYVDKIEGEGKLNA